MPFITQMISGTPPVAIPEQGRTMRKTIKNYLLGAAMLAVTACTSLGVNPEGQVIRQSLHHAVDIGTPGGSGSGVWIGSDLVLTAKHVISFSDRDQRVKVRTFAGQVLEAELIAEGEGEGISHDWALLRVSGANRQHWARTSCDAVDYGQSVVSIGNAYASTGLVAFIGKIQMRDYSVAKITKNSGLWQHGFTVSAHGAPGVSGGPVFDMQGRLIGLNVAGLPPQVLMVVYPTQYISVLCGEHEDK